MRMTCSVMSERLLFTLLAITKASPNPWSTEILQTVHEARHLWKTLCTSKAHVDCCGSHITHMQTHTLDHRLTVRWCCKKYSIDTWWQAQEDKYVLHVWNTKYLSTDSERREILTVQSQGHREKWSRRWRGVNMKKWLDAIKKRWKEKGNITGASSGEM